jgi:hypothetical protein
MDGDYRLAEFCLQKLKAHPMKHTAIRRPEHEGTNFRARSQNVAVERQGLKRLHGGGLERESGAGWPKLRLALEDLALEAGPSEGYSKSEATDTAARDEYLTAGLDCRVHAIKFSDSGPNLRCVSRHANGESNTRLSSGTKPSSGWLPERREPAILP